MTGAMLLFTFYLDGPRANIRVAPENGPATADFKALLLDSSRSRIHWPEEWAIFSPCRRKTYLAMLKEALRNRMRTLMHSALTALEERLGAKEADRLLVRVCSKAALAYPIQTARLLTQEWLRSISTRGCLSARAPTISAWTFRSPLADDRRGPRLRSMQRHGLRHDRNLRWLIRAAILMAVIALRSRFELSSLPGVAIAPADFFDCP